MIKTKSGPFTLPALPYEQNALEPFISANTLGIHHGKHHQAYVDKLNELVLGTEFADLELEEIIIQTAGRPDKVGIFNNASQVWNHTFYWNSLSPKKSKKPTGELARRIEVDFGGYLKFTEQFVQMGLDQFGSGWVWLVKSGDALKIVKTSNAENPLSQSKSKALFVFDVWEHAYYLDYQNRRKEYLKAAVDHLIDWEFAEKNF